MSILIPKKDPIYEYAKQQREALYLTRRTALDYAKYDLKTFIACVKTDYIFEWVHLNIIETLQKFLFSDSLNFLMILTPPRVGKSELSSSLLISYALGIMAERVLRGGVNPYEIMQANYSSELSAEFVSRQTTYNESREYNDIFPKIRMCPRGSIYGTEFKRSTTEYDMIADIQSERFNEQKGGVYRKAATVRAFGLGGSVTGRGSHLIVLDDLIKGPREASSKRLKDEAWDWYNTALSTRLQKDYGIPGKILILNTRWAKDDIPGRLLETEGDKWKVLRFPAYAYEKDSENRIKEDKRKQGEILSERRKQDIESAKRRLSSSDFAALYQQVPVAEGGNLIKGKDIMFWKKKPDKFDYLLISGDLAYKDGEENDWTVLQLWGYHHNFEDENRYWLLEQIRGKYNYTAQRELIKDFAKRNPNIWATYVEDDGRGSALLSDLKKEIHNFRLWPERGEGRTDKITRVQTVQHLFEQHKVYYPSIEKYPAIQENIDEITDFPKAKHDDTVDATTMGLIQLKKITQVHASALLLARDKPLGFKSPRYKR